MHRLDKCNKISSVITCIFRLVSSYSDKIVSNSYFKTHFPKFFETVNFYSKLTPQQALESFRALDDKLDLNKMQNSSKILKTFQCTGKTIRTLNGEISFNNGDGGKSTENMNPDAMNKIGELNDLIFLY